MLVLIESFLESLNIGALNFKTDCQIENTRLARRILKGQISKTTPLSLSPKRRIPRCRVSATE